MKKLIITGIALLLPMLASAYEEGKEYHEEADYVDDNGYFYQLNRDLTAMITYKGGMKGRKVGIFIQIIILVILLFPAVL